MVKEINLGIEDEESQDNQKMFITKIQDKSIEIKGTLIGETNKIELKTKIINKTPLCRICYCSEEEVDSPLINPCCCSGTMKYIHLSCLQQWYIISK